MTVGEWLKGAEAQLKAAGIGSARLDALVLLEDVTGQDRARLLAEPEIPLSAAKLAKLTKLLTRRAGHEPLAYIRGFTEFYGREFVITPQVLEPRPESETMIDLLKELPEARHPELVAGSRTPKTVHIADVGAGSGALGITAKLELPEAEIDLLEIDPGAIRTAKTNVDKFTLTLRVLRTDLLRGTDRNYDILLCNLPYVPDNFHINEAAAREPRIAIFGGPDGLDLYRKLFEQLKSRPDQPLFILTESLPPQHQRLSAVAADAGYEQRRESDFIQLFARKI